VPKQTSRLENTPRRRGANAIVVDADAERGFILSLLLRSPKDLIAGALAFAAVSAIIANALFLQAGHHPSPMFGSVVTFPAAEVATANPLPRPRPVEASAKPAEAPVMEQKPVESKTADPLTNLVKSTSTSAVTSSGFPRPPAAIPVSARSDTVSSSGSRRVAAVQRALTEYGYGQLKPTGTIGADTQAAIQKFERERKIPVTGQVSDRLVRELTAMTGKPIG
jgi:hypothetical protein